MLSGNLNSLFVIPNSLYKKIKHKKQKKCKIKKGKLRKKKKKYYKKHSLKLNNQGKHSTFQNYLKSKNI